MFSTSCCSFEVSEVCIESRSPPKGNLALNWSDIMGREGCEVEVGGVVGSELRVVAVVVVTVAERATWATEVVLVIVVSPGLVVQLGGR